MRAEFSYPGFKRSLENPSPRSRGTNDAKAHWLLGVLDRVHQSSQKVNKDRHGLRDWKAFPAESVSVALLALNSSTNSWKRPAKKGSDRSDPFSVSVD